MANQTGVDDIEALVNCEFPGCVHRMRYSGRGRPPRYCGQSVDGLVHTRLTARAASRSIYASVTGSTVVLALVRRGIHDPSVLFRLLRAKLKMR